MAAKFAVAAVATAVLLAYTQTLSSFAQVAGGTPLTTADLSVLRSPSVFVHTAGVLVLLTLAPVLAVYKPAGLTGADSVSAGRLDRCGRAADARSGGRCLASSQPSAEGSDHVAARLLAPAARLGAHLAVLARRGVLLALGRARPAGGGARLKERAGEVGVVAGVAGQGTAGGGAMVAAVEVGADALGELRDHVLAQARVGARGTPWAHSKHAGMQSARMSMPTPPRCFGYVSSISLCVMSPPSPVAGRRRAARWVGSVGGALVDHGPRLTRQHDHTIECLHRRLDTKSAESLQRRMHFPVGWDPFSATR